MNVFNNVFNNVPLMSEFSYDFEFDIPVGFSEPALPDNLYFPNFYSGYTFSNNYMFSNLSNFREPLSMNIPYGLNNTYYWPNSLNNFFEDDTNLLLNYW